MSAKRRRPTNLRSAPSWAADASSSTSNGSLWVNIRSLDATWRAKYMEMFDLFWPCLTMFDDFWGFLMIFDDYVWYCLIMFDHSWSFFGMFVRWKGIQGHRHPLYLPTHVSKIAHACQTSHKIFPSVPLVTPIIWLPVLALWHLLRRTACKTLTRMRFPLYYFQRMLAMYLKKIKEIQLHRSYSTSLHTYQMYQELGLVSQNFHAASGRHRSGTGKEKLSSWDAQDLITGSYWLGLRLQSG